MELYSSNESYKLYQGNMIDMLGIIEKESIDSIVTDPPYELNFMSKGWDNAGVSFQPDTWEKCYEVLKPGGYLLAFGGSRTFHRIACAIEDAGFEIRDTIMWLYGSGFPKSMNIGLALDKKNGVESEIIGKRKEHDIRNNNYANNNVSDKTFIREIKKATNEWQGWGTALKPSFEPIIVARKPFKGSLVDNVIENGVGGINIDECRVGMSEDDKQQYYDKQKSFEKTYQNKESIYEGNSLQKSKTSFYDINILTKKTLNQGRFPANTILTYDETDFDEVCGGFPNTKSQVRISEDKDIKQNTFSLGRTGITPRGHNDSGSASRYFYCAKASKKDRDEGLDEFEDINGGSYQFRQDGSLDGKIPVRKNTHPTVKPTSLMQYLVRLVTPNNGIILDPFNGSGSTGKAVMYENKEKNKNYKYIGIELTEEYLPIAKARIECVCRLVEEEKNEERQLSIYDLQ